MLTVEDLYKKLAYNKDTGEFTWLEFNKYHPDLQGTKAGGLNSAGYVHIKIDGVKHKAHRLAFLYMEGKYPSKTVDHINRVKHDNRWCNLREADMFEQNENQCIRKDNTSGYKGINWNKRNRKWDVRLSINKQRLFLGTFTRLEDAVNKLKATKEYYK